MIEMRGRAATSLALGTVVALAACARAHTEEEVAATAPQRTIELRLRFSPQDALRIVQAAARDAGLLGGGRVVVSGNSTGSGQRSEVVIGPYRLRQHPETEVTLRAVVMQTIGGGGEYARVVLSGTERIEKPTGKPKLITRPIIRRADDDEEGWTWDELERLAAAIRARAE